MARVPQDVDAQPDSATIDALAKLVRESGSAALGANPKIPAGYTYLGQFVDHDITLDSTSDVERQNYRTLAS